MIRRATPDDLERLTEIYNQAVASRRATGDVEALTPAQREGWFAQNQNARTPIYVYRQDGTVTGYASLAAYRPGRRALDAAAEISYYVDYAYHRRGIAAALMRHLLSEAAALGYKTLIAVVLSCNKGSITLLQKFGFEHWGTLPDVVSIDDAVYSHFFYGLRLDEARLNGTGADGAGAKAPGVRRSGQATAAAPAPRPKVYRINTVIDCAPGGAGTLAAFYSRLLGWRLTHPAAGGWAAITAPNGSVFAFQEVEGYQPPTWPWQPGKPGQMLHLDFWVPDLEPAAEYALGLGAQPAPVQYFKSSRTLLDPAGHPFCLDTDAPED